VKETLLRNAQIQIECLVEDKLWQSSLSIFARVKNARYGFCWADIRDRRTRPRTMTSYPRRTNTQAKTPRCRRFARGNERRAAAVVELAMLLPLLIFLFIISVDFARVYYYSLTLTNCARAGAMYASDPSTAAESPFANVTAAALADATNITPTPTVQSATGVDLNGQAYAEVTVKYTFKTLTGFPGVPNELLLSRTVRMNVSASTPSTY
jgi:Flp pilus assembly protein TadG